MEASKPQKSSPFHEQELELLHLAPELIVTILQELPLGTKRSITLFPYSFQRAVSPPPAPTLLSCRRSRRVCIPLFPSILLKPQINSFLVDLGHVMFTCKALFEHSGAETLWQHRCAMDLDLLFKSPDVRIKYIYSVKFYITMLTSTHLTIVDLAPALLLPQEGQTLLPSQCPLL